MVSSGGVVGGGIETPLTTARPTMPAQVTYVTINPAN
jgi:hypothetical protein